MDTIRIAHGQARIIAHRGLSGIEPENTHVAFTAAGNRSYFGIETDVHVTRDGQFIVIHDDNTLRVSGEDHIVEQTDFSALRSLRLLEKGQTTRSAHLRLPTLEEYLSICRRYEKTAVLELKNPMGDVTVERLIKQICAHGSENHVIFISFSFENLQAVRKYLPDSRCQYLFVDPEAVSLDAIEHEAFDVDVEYSHLTKAWIDQFHDRGILVNAWTVDDLHAAEQLISWKIDYLTTNILE